jgi:formate hydrogenlyase subunit 3/multisubunit Na+/H+ antiporter MnhD subunit
MLASAKHMEPVDVSEPIRCAVVVKPSKAEKHQTEVVRYFVLVIALVAVFLLIAIALYYMQAKSVTIEHVSSLASPLILRA